MGAKTNKGKGPSHDGDFVKGNRETAYQQKMPEAVAILLLKEGHEAAFWSALG
jgi:hypothetical protein